MKNKIYIFALLLLLVLSSCKIKRTSDGIIYERAGTEGLAIDFLPNSPPARIVVGKADREINVVVEARNKGAYPELDRKKPQKLEGKLFIGGFAKNIIDFKDNDKIDLNSLFLEGRSNANPSGGFDLAEFKGIIKSQELPFDKFSPVFSAIACYKYQTVATTPVCIDAEPYSDLRINKVCKIHPITLATQGAPIAVIKLDEEVLSDSIQFRIAIKNVGNGDVLDAEPIKCDPNANTEEARIQRKNFDLVKLKSVQLEKKELKCRPLVKGTSGNEEYIRLINGEGFLLCSADITSNMRAQAYGYTTPLEITLDYAYRNTIQKQVEIVKLKE